MINDPTQILDVGFGFWGSKVLLTAVKLDVFTLLGEGSMTGNELGTALELHPRGIWDFFDALVAMGFLDRDGDGEEGRYKNTGTTLHFLDKNSHAYIGGILEMCNDRLYKYWGDLETGLKTGQPQNEAKHGDASIFEVLYSDPVMLEQFLSAMRGISFGNFTAFATGFDFSRYNTLCDVGGATSLLSSLVAQKHPHMTCQSFDLPPVKPIAEKWIEKDGVSGQVTAVAGDFFKDSLPKADVITMGMILHDWSLENKKHLVRLAYDALPKGGAFVAIENIIDDARRENIFGLLMSLNMLIEFGEAFDFTGAEFWRWSKETGFSRYEVVHLAGPCSAAIAYK
jgi:hypothetical protein